MNDYISVKRRGQIYKMSRADYNDMLEREKKSNHAVGRSFSECGTKSETI